MYTVILADDEPYILRGLERKLPWEEMGYRIVGRAGNGLDCFDQVRELIPDILITDIRMPGLTGLDLLEKIRTLPAPPRVIYISGYSEFEYARRALELGAVSYVLKPISRDMLREALERARESIEREQKDDRVRGERGARETVELIRSLPAETAGPIVLERLGLQGRYDGYLCVITEPESTAAEYLRSRDLPADSIQLPLNDRSTLWVLNLSPDRAAMLERTLLRRGSDSRATGISLFGTRPAEISELIRQARVAFCSGFAVGERTAARYAPTGSGALGEMTGDFESLFAEGNEGRVHRLLDQACEICRRERPSAEAILAFYNFFLTLLGRLQPERDRTVPVLPLVSDCEQLTGRFTDAARMIEFLHEEVRDRYAVATDEAGGRASAGDTISAVRLFIRKHLDADLSLDALAERFQADKAHLGASFRAAMGRTLAEYVREVRIGHACFLLRNTRLTVQEIAAMCGYADYFYFAKLFRRERGITASEFRRRKAPTT